MQIYTCDEVYAACLDYFEGDELAAAVITNKYLLRDSEGNFKELNPEDLFKRLTKEFTRIEKQYPNSLSTKEIYQAFDKFKYIIPQGSPMAGIGNPYQVTSLGNCFVIGNPIDSYGGILYKDQELAQIMKRRGGVGIDISTIRPMGAMVNNAARTSDGIRSFMNRYSNTTEEVAMQGRRGALLISIDCRHPDIMTFINIKNNKTKVTSANISIRWHDDFLKAVENDETYTLRFPVDVSLNKATVKREVNAKEVWEAFIESNWQSAEPGCLFWDKIQKQSMSDCYEKFGYKTVSTNPCGELPLSEYGACILMAMNLTGFVENPHTESSAFNINAFEKYIKIGVRLIDDMIDLELEKIEIIIEKIKNDPEPDYIKAVELELWIRVKKSYDETRRVGLGITGLADMVAMLGYDYGSPECQTFIEDIFTTFQYLCYEESSTLAKERGHFKIWDWELEKNCHYIKLLPKETQDHIKKYGRRNIAMNTCAPAGSISILAQTSSGIEPIFMRKYQRSRKLNPDEAKRGIKPDRIDEDGNEWVTYDVFHKGLQDWLDVNPGKAVEDSPYWGSEAGELNSLHRVKLQSIIQKYIDHSISSTVNLPADVDVKVVDELYKESWKLGCKGITIYREGSREGVITKIDAIRIKETNCPKRPNLLEADIHYSTIQGKEWILFAGMMDDHPYEIFGGKRSNIEIPKKYKTGWIKKNGRNQTGRRTYDLILGSLEDESERLVIQDIASEFSPNIGEHTRLLSANLRYGIPVRIIIEQLYKINPEADLFCFEKSMARVLKKYVKDGEMSSNLCTQCQSKNMQYQEGCAVCLDCGFSACG